MGARGLCYIMRKSLVRTTRQKQKLYWWLSTSQVERPRQTFIMGFGKMMTEQNVVRFDAEVARVDDTTVSSDFLGTVKMYRPLLWPLVAMCQHLDIEN